MRKRVIITAIFLLFELLVHSQDRYLIDWEYTGQTFEAFMRETESRYPVRFLYREEWISDLNLDRYGSYQELFALLDSLFSGLNVYCYPSSLWNIIFTGEFAIKMPEKPAAGDQKYMPVNE